jgi:hypothetical protein
LFYSGGKVIEEEGRQRELGKVFSSIFPFSPPPEKKSFYTLTIIFLSYITQKPSQMAITVKAPAKEGDITED